MCLSPIVTFVTQSFDFPANKFYLDVNTYKGRQMDKFIVDSEELWHHINDLYKNKGGVYRLHCFSSDDHQDVIPVHRTIGADPDGVLYIGKADCFLDRVIELKKSLLPKYKTDTHICGRRYWNDMLYRFRMQFPLERLCVSLVKSDTPEESEKKELEEYCIKFGEIPPLNRMG